MKTKLPLSMALLGFTSLIRSQAAQIEIPDFSLTPDGSTANPTQITDVSTPNDETNVLAMSESTAYFVTTFTFGADSFANLEAQFLAGNGADRIGIQIQGNGNVRVPGTAGQLLDFDDLTDQPSPSSFNFGESMAGQTVVILAKLQFDTDFNTFYNVRFGNGNAHGGANTLMNVWINPTVDSLEGSGPAAGDLYAIWNSAGFPSFEQQIFNLSTPETAEASAITDTVILTDTDATFANALALATAGTTVDVPVSLTIAPNALNPGSFDFSWQPNEGRIYDLVSSVDLSTSPDTWSVWEGQSDLAGTEVTGVAGGPETRRFFALVEKDAP